LHADGNISFTTRAPYGITLRIFFFYLNVENFIILIALLCEKIQGILASHIYVLGAKYMVVVLSMICIKVTQ